MSFNPAHCEVYSIQHYVIKFVSDLQIYCFSGTLVSSTNKTSCHHIAEIFLKVVLNTITLTLENNFSIKMIVYNFFSMIIKSWKLSYLPFLNHIFNMCVNSDDGNLWPINMQDFMVITDLEKNNIVWRRKKIARDVWIRDYLFYMYELKINMFY